MVDTCALEINKLLLLLLSGSKVNVKVEATFLRNGRWIGFKEIKERK